MTDVSNLDNLAAAIASSSPKIKAYAKAQAAATQSQELDIQGAQPLYVDARAFGAKFDGVTDDTGALQAAIDSCPLPNYMNMPRAFDWPARVLQLPAGRAKITAPLLLPSNFTLRGHSPGSTYLQSYHDGNAVQLATGNEVQTTIRDLGIILQNALGKGIDLVQSSQLSILSDANHQVDNVVVVGGQRALYCKNNTESRFTNILAYRQKPPLGDACIWIGGTDHMVERVTVAQPQHSGAEEGGAALRANTSNTRFVNIKVFGGQASPGGLQFAFYLIGQRNQVHGLEVQDFPGKAVADDQFNNMYSGVVIDSCLGTAISVGGPVMMRNVLVVNRGQTPFTMPAAFGINNDVGADIDARVAGVANLFDHPSRTGAGNFIRVNGVNV